MTKTIGKAAIKKTVTQVSVNQQHAEPSKSGDKGHIVRILFHQFEDILKEMPDAPCAGCNMTFLEGGY